MERILKKSKQRDALLEILRGTTCHPDAAWLYQQLRGQFPRISLATVYRNLNLLLAKGEIIKIDVGDGTEHYDGIVKSHAHFVCDRCCKIYDAEPLPMQKIEQSAADLLGAEIKSHSLVFYGTCQSCRE